MGISSGKRGLLSGGDFWGPLGTGHVLFLDPGGGYMVVEKLVCCIIICKTMHLYFIHSSV